MMNGIKEQIPNPKKKAYGSSDSNFVIVTTIAAIASILSFREIFMLAIDPIIPPTIIADKEIPHRIASQSSEGFGLNSIAKQDRNAKGIKILLENIVNSPLDLYYTIFEMASQQ